MGVSNSKGTVEALDNGAKSDTFNLADAEKLVNPPDLPDESEEEALIVQQEKQDNVESIPVKAGTENSSDEVPRNIFTLFVPVPQFTEIVILISCITF